MVKLKKLLKESKYAWDRQFGDPLPTLKDVMETHPKTPLREAKFKKQYKSLKGMRKDLDRIFGTRNGLGNIGHPRVRLKRGSEFDKVGRMQPSYIEIEGDKMWVDAYKKIAFNGRGDMGDVIKHVRKETVNDNA